MPGGRAAAQDKSGAQLQSSEGLGAKHKAACECVCVCLSVRPKERGGVGRKCIQASELKELQGLGRREQRRQLGGGWGENAPARRPWLR